MKILMDYESILTNRVILITGAGRSGTTILGKLIGSMDPAFYFFEPTLIKFGFSGTSMEVVQASFVEDFVLPMIQGRTVNTNPDDDSWIGHYEPEQAYKRRRQDLPRRDDALCYIERVNPKFVIKLTDFIPAIGYMRSLFPDLVCINIVRNPNDVISSGIKRGWWTDEWLMTAPELMAERTLLKTPRPWYIKYKKAATQAQWAAWTPETRAACAWYTVRGTVHDKADLIVDYENLAVDPGSVVSAISDLTRLKRTEQTKLHMHSVVSHDCTTHPDVLKSVDRKIRKKIVDIANLHMASY